MYFILYYILKQPVWTSGIGIFSIKVNSFMANSIWISYLFNPYTQFTVIYTSECILNIYLNKHLFT